MSEDKIQNLKNKMDTLQSHMSKLNDPNSMWCSFCGKDKSEISQMFYGPDKGVRICNECVRKCYANLN